LSQTSLWTGKGPTDDALRKNANQATINYQNVSVTFRKLDTREPDGETERLMKIAFIVGAERDRLLKELSPNEIVARAMICIEQAPRKGGVSTSRW
jgi:hypothetical protein